MNTFFTADTHFGHKNIIKFCNRPFTSAEEMDEALIKNWNQVVKPEDIVYHLGDVTWYGPAKTREILTRLNGTKRLIKGNHDRTSNLSPYFESIKMYDTIRIGKVDIILMHFPILSWDRQFYGSIHLHGHTHNCIDNSGVLRFDVGVEGYNYTPISLDQILEALPDKEKEAVGENLDRIDKFKKLYYRAVNDETNI